MSTATERTPPLLQACRCGPLWPRQPAKGLCMVCRRWMQRHAVLTARIRAWRARP